MSKQKRFGKQPTRYKFFFLNPYQDVRFSYCPKCDAKTKLRKVPLAIDMSPPPTELPILESVVLKAVYSSPSLVAVNKRCRYCPSCDLLIVHQDEVEQQVTSLCGEEEAVQELMENKYLVIGTLDRADWQRNDTAPMTPEELLDCTYVFKKVLKFEPKRYTWVKEV